MNFKFPSFVPRSLQSLIQCASPDAIDLIRDMLQYDPYKRPTASECLQYPLFQVKLPIPIDAPDFDH